MSKSPADFSNWNAQILRFTAFVTTAVVEQEASWRNATGGEPDVDENRAKEGLRRQVGPFGEGELEIQVTPARVDILLTPLTNAGATLAPHFEDAPGAVAAFGDAVHRWLSNTPIDAYRVAFGAVLMLPADSREDAYSALSGLVHSVKVDAQKSKELFYRINHPRPSKVLKGEELNRITAWSSVIYKRMVSTGAIITGGRAPILPVISLDFVRLEVDNSTSAERENVLERTQLDAIYDELVALAVENATSGECQ